MRIIHDGFNATVYHAGSVLNLVNSHPEGINTYLYDNTPSSVMYKTGKENGMTTTTKAWQDLQTLLGGTDDPSKLLDKPYGKNKYL